MTEFLQTQEVGSLAKPNWRVEPLQTGRLTPEHLHEIERWGEKLGFDPDDIAFDFQQIQENFSCPEDQCRDWAKESLRFQAARFATALQVKAGLDIVYDGEQDRSEMYQHAIERTNGFDWRGRVRAFDDKSYRKAASIGAPSVREPWHENEVTRLQNFTDRPIKVPVTGAYTLAAWSYDEHFGSRRDLVRALAQDVVRPTIESLLEQGVTWVQIDEPAATTVPSEVDLFVESFNESVRGLLGKFSVHICFSDYSLLFPKVSALENCSQFSLEFANRDAQGLGQDGASRPAYEILGKVKEYCPGTSVGLGVVSVHDDHPETPQLVRDRVLRTVDILGDPALVYPSPDCGLRTRSWDIAYEKLQAVVEGTQLAKEKLA